MATHSVYMGALKDLAVAVGLKMGTDLAGEPKNIRVGIKATHAGVAVLMKVLTDAGIITDQQLQAAFEAATDAAYPDEPNLP